MNMYEAMIIIKPDLGEEARKELFTQISDAVTKHKGIVSQAVIWSEKRKLTFSIKKFDEGVYYLLNFTAPGSAITEIKLAYRLNENILRAMITVQAN